MATTMSQPGFLNSTEKHNNSTLYTNLHKSSTTGTMKQTKNTKFKNEVEAAAKQFFGDRKITVINLNTEISRSQVYQTLEGYGVTVTDFNEDLRIATIQISDCSRVLDVIRKLSGSFDVTVEPSKKLLCITNLPLDCSNILLRQYMSSYGNLTKCFMYRCSQTGESLGYGFIEFDCSIEKTKQIQAVVDWMNIEDHHVHCDFVDITSYDKLCSRCLMIDNLPKDFIDVMSLRDIFSCFYSPLYCQIVTKDGESLGYGIVEFKTHEEAQRSQVKLKGHVINGQPIRISYCIPGKSGIYMCSRILAKFDSGKMSSKKGLLPDPVFLKDDLMKTPLARQLCDQQPDLMPCFKQALNQLQQTYMSQVTGSTKPGLLGPAPSVAMNPLLNPNMQLGLLLLLALQIQSNSQNKLLGPLEQLGLAVNQQTNQHGGQTSILGNPLAAQASVMLKNLTSQVSFMHPLISNPVASQKLPNNNQHNLAFLQQSMALNLKNLNMNMLINLGQLASSLQSSTGILGSAPQTLMQKENPKSVIFSRGPQLSMENCKHGNKTNDQKPKCLLDLDFSILDNGYDRLGSVKENIPYNGENVAQQRIGNSQPRNHSDISAEPVAKQFRNTHPVQCKKTNSYFEQNVLNGTSKRLGTSAMCLEPDKLYHNRSQGSDFLFGRSNNISQKSYGSSAYDTEHECYGNSAWIDKQDGLMPPPNNINPRFIPPQRENSAMNKSQVGRNYSNFIEHAMMNSPSESLVSPPLLPLCSTDLSLQEDSSLSRSQTSSLVDYSDLFTSSYEPSYRSNESFFSDGGYFTECHSTPGSVNTTRRWKTPIGRKRSYSNLFPPPEPSPEGGFVGQHSQGIGGHYADSYRKRQKMDREDLTNMY